MDHPSTQPYFTPSILVKTQTHLMSQIVTLIHANAEPSLLEMLICQQRKFIVTSVYIAMSLCICNNCHCSKAHSWSVFKRKDIPQKWQEEPVLALEVSLTRMRIHYPSQLVLCGVLGTLGPTGSRWRPVHLSTDGDHESGTDTACRGP